MANPYARDQFLYKAEASVFEYYAHVSFGAAGAPTLDTSNSKGILSISRQSAGQYLITLVNPGFRKLLNVSAMQFPGVSAPAAPLCVLEANSVSSSPATIVLQYRAIDNSTATDPASGEQVFISITLGNSSV